MNQIFEHGLVKLLSTGGLFMWFILAASIIATVIGIERYLAYRFRLSIDGRQLFNEIKKYLTVKDYHRAIESCRQYPHVPLAQVLVAGLTHSDQSSEEMETAMESEALYYVPRINDRLGYLGMLSNVATLLGLLGTVSGLIASFAAVGGLQEAGLARGQALAGGIAESMYTTAFGLVVAIPTLLVYQFLSNRANRIIDDIQHFGTDLKKLVQRLKAEGQYTYVSFKHKNYDEVSKKTKTPLGEAAPAAS